MGSALVAFVVGAVFCTLANIAACTLASTGIGGGVRCGKWTEG